MLYAVPSCFNGTSFGTVGQRTLGTNENAIPIITIIIIGIHAVPVPIGDKRSNNDTTTIRHPVTRSLLAYPYLSFM